MSFTFVLSCDDAGAYKGNINKFRELLNFFNENNTPCTFFVTPFSGRQVISDDWIQALGTAIDYGHELEMHGLTHQGEAVGFCEFGIPPAFVLDIVDGWKKEVEEKQELILNEVTVENLSKKIRKGLDIFTEKLNIRPEGFRAPCFAFHKNMFLALKENDFRFDSSIPFNSGAFRYTAKRKGLMFYDKDYLELRGWEENMPTKPYLHESGIIEVPLIAEYTWNNQLRDNQLVEGDIVRQVDLAINDMDKIIEEGGVFVPVCHYFAMTSDYSAGMKVYEKIFNYARKKSAEFVTMKKAVRKANL